MIDIAALAASLTICNVAGARLLGWIPPLDWRDLLGCFTLWFLASALAWLIWTHSGWFV